MTLGADSESNENSTVVHFAVAAKNLQNTCSQSVAATQSANAAVAVGNAFGVLQVAFAADEVDKLAESLDPRFVALALSISIAAPEVGFAASGAAVIVRCEASFGLAAVAEVGRSNCIVDR